MDETNKIIPEEALRAVSESGLKNIIRMAREGEEADKDFNSAIEAVCLTSFYLQGDISLLVVRIANIFIFTNVNLLGYRLRKQAKIIVC